MRRLFNALWGSVAREDWFATLWFDDRECLHLPLPQILASDDEDLAELVSYAGKRNTYFGLAPRRDGLGPTRQGGKKDVVALTAFAVDIDFYNPKAHKAENLPPDLDSAWEALVDGEGNQLPDPGAVVMTGNGAHLYWFLEEPMIFSGLPSDRDGFGRKRAEELYKAFQAPIIAAAKELGWHVDSTATIQRVWRVPGTTNFKTNRLVELIHCDGSRAGLEDLGLGAALQQLGTPPQTHSQTRSLPSHSAREPLGQVLPPPDGLEALWGALGAYSGEHRIEVQNVLRGLSFAERGSRNETMTRVAGVIAWMPEAREMVPEELVAALIPSLSVWADEPGASKTLEEEVEVATRMIETAREKLAGHLEVQRRALAPLARALRLSEDTTADEAPPEEISNEFISKRAIIAQGAWLRVFDFRPERMAYGFPITRDDLPAVVRDYWEDAPEGIDRCFEDEKGRTKTKATARLLEEYCTVVKGIVADMTIDRAFLDVATDTFYEPAAPLRNLEPEFDKDFDAYLKVIAGSCYGKLCDWFATAVRVDEPTCALYLKGGPSLGKSMLVAGLARLWEAKAPTNFEHAMGGFNSQLTESPLLFADEGFSDHARRNLSTRFREIVGSREHEVRDKFANKKRMLHGCLRVVVCANNDRLLDFGALNELDQKALAERILYVQLADEGAAWLKDRRQLTERWVEGDGIAKHCLWLALNRKVESSGRFLVEGDESLMHRKLATATNVDGLVLTFLASFVSDPAKIYAGAKRPEKPLLLVGKECLWVKSQGVLKHWPQYLDADYKKPNPNVCGEVIRKLSSKQVQPPEFGRTRYFEIRLDILLEWCEEKQIGDMEAMVENLMKDEWQ